MRIVLIKVGEPLPDIQDERQQRMGLLADEFARRGHDVTWITNTADRRDGSLHAQKRLEYRTALGINVVAVKSIGYGRKVSLRRLLDSYLASALIAYEFLKMDRAELCIISLPLVEVGAVVGVVARLRNIPTVVDVRDLYPDNYIDALPTRPRFVRAIVGPILRWQAKVALRAPTARYAISNDFLRWADELAGEGKHNDRAFPLPFPGGLEEPPAPVVRNAGDPLLVVYLGAFNRIIDLETVAAAARLLDASHPGKFRFVLAGDGEFRERAERSADRCEAVEFPGWLEPDQVRALLAKADVGLAPYRPASAFAMGNKYMEYMWASIPILTTHEPIAKELRSHGAAESYVDAPSLANRLVEFLDGESSISASRAHQYFVDVLHRGQSHIAMADALEELAGQRAALTKPQIEPDPAMQSEAVLRHRNAGVAQSVNNDRV